MPHQHHSAGGHPHLHRVCRELFMQVQSINFKYEIILLNGLSFFNDRPV